MLNITRAAVILIGHLAGACTARSEDVPYFVGDVWGVWQHLPPKENAAPNDRPQCKLGTTTWPNRGLNFVYVLTSADYIEPRLQIYSENWELPVGNKTPVDLMTIAGRLSFELVAESTNALTGSTDPKVVGKDRSFNVEVALSYMLDSRRKGISTRVKFAGSEPEWYIPPMGQFETYQINAKLNGCIADLRGKAADRFRRDGGKPDGRPSPFAQ
ncbi:hypothetical protein [Neorhizobium galegae]|uniref:Lipoprotein n=1 Tax=Neorhizobium galegae bv. officinalis TaxID=323656 RepID=A0A0T7GAH4_NEOGA|nr:hypothetical protein [Neorhizobium galegae]CDZ44269.1 Hypothetical protein NGAL_HAMBI1189_02640 [Neorhizobium galegae bv. officinalis]